MKIFILKILQYILKQLSRLALWRYKPDIIAITGSVGKTSAKEAIYAVLSHSGKKIRKSGGNLNNELGVPLAILGEWSEKDLELVSLSPTFRKVGDLWQPAGEKKLRKLFFWLKVIMFSFFRIVFLPKYFYPKILILEYGADRPGDIKKLLEIAKPKIGIITAIGDIPVHVEFYPVRKTGLSNGVYSGPEAVAKEKSKLIERLFVSDFAILNFDDQQIIEAKEKTRAKIMTFGFGLEADTGGNPDIKIVNFENCFSESNFSGINFKIEYQGSVVPLTLKNTFGKAQAYAAGVAACVGLIYGLNLVEISETLSRDYKPAKHRMNLVKGAKGCLIINDCYNASPLSMKSALETLADIKIGQGIRKIAVLGDMRELGEYSEKAHKDIGKLAAGIVDILVAVSEKGKTIAESAEQNGLAKNKIFTFDTAEQAAKAVKEIIQKGDITLVKASRGVGLERVVEEIRA